MCVYLIGISRASLGFFDVVEMKKADLATHDLASHAHTHTHDLASHAHTHDLASHAHT